MFFALYFNDKQNKKIRKKTRNIPKTQTKTEGSSICTSKGPVRQKLPNESTMKQNFYKNTIEFLLSWSLTPGHRSYSVEHFIYPLRLHWGK